MIRDNNSTDNITNSAGLYIFELFFILLSWSTFLYLHIVMKKERNFLGLDFSVKWFFFEFCCNSQFQEFCPY